MTKPLRARRGKNMRAVFATAAVALAAVPATAAPATCASLRAQHAFILRLKAKWAEHVKTCHMRLAEFDKAKRAGDPLVSRMQGDVTACRWDGITGPGKSPDNPEVAQARRLNAEHRCGLAF